MMLTAVGWIVIAPYFVLSLVIGVAHSRRASKSASMLGKTHPVAQVRPK